MCDALHLNTLKQCPTPLNTLFFSEFNMNLLQRGIRQSFRDQTGVAIDYQNPSDLYSIMRVVFINNSGDPNANVQEQVKYMNGIVIKTASGQIQTGVSQYMGYVHDIDTLAVPIDRPVNTTTYGKKFGKSEQIGL
ncbi:hypothetical protein BpV1_131 [Bathycoccus sp. RCC1105 virus BpV1]|jgi:hypothetical protein|uniref:hypothetical protein n=1 Tax=Bathycoccus sp. RCC1105 virus BpV1 TaxID=880159 RepID=UPI0001EF4473|nr:hypothetical protein BpV1_131 [Bathycoccus sp. RCC1105 virus BpV1]ADQ91758.1 hypothetical protein BpV1_131 [Bathycoccus sp. RCC1105 virus BpV1]